MVDLSIAMLARLPEGIPRERSFWQVSWAHSGWNCRKKPYPKVFPKQLRMWVWKTTTCISSRKSMCLTVFNHYFKRFKQKHHQILTLAIHKQALKQPNKTYHVWFMGIVTMNNYKPARIKMLGTEAYTYCIIIRVEISGEPPCPPILLVQTLGPDPGLLQNE